MDELYDELLAVCLKYGYPTQATYEVLQLVGDTLTITPTEPDE